MSGVYVINHVWDAASRTRINGLYSRQALWVNDHIIVGGGPPEAHPGSHALTMVSGGTPPPVEKNQVHLTASGSPAELAVTCGVPIIADKAKVTHKIAVTINNKPMYLLLSDS